MSDPATVVSSEPLVSEGLSQWQRLIYIFVAPRRTFTDILRSSSWWLPFVLTVLVSYGFTYAVGTRITWEKVADNTIQQSPKQADRFANMTPEQAARLKKGMATSFRYFSYATPLLSLLAAAIVAALLLATVNFIFGGKATFKQMMAVYFYSTFPLNLKYLLAIIVLFAGINPDQFQIQNPIGSNLGYYLSPDTPAWLMALATELSVFALWGVILFSLGSAIVAHVKPSQGAKAVVGWWILLVLMTVAWAAMGKG